MAGLKNKKNIKKKISKKPINKKVSLKSGVKNKKPVKKIISKKIVKKTIKKPVKKIFKKVIKKISKKTTKKIVKKVLKKKVVKKNKKLLKKNINGRDSTHKLERYVGNPIIHPARDTYWESTATFNPTAFLHDGKVHVLYRAVGVGDISTIGYAHSLDGYNLAGRNFKPVYIHSNTGIDKDLPVFYSSGGGWNGGAEDPRVTKIDGRLYMTYTAFDGWGSVRIGLTSISLDDFLSKKWNWKTPVLISPPGEINKNWAIFPEKIKGKYAIIHSFYPEILIDYFDDLNELDGTKFIKSNNTRPIDHTRDWDSWFRGIGPAPIKTKEGWLIIYHAMDHKNANKYKIGALLLDLKDPTKILYRSKKPILEPDMFYENEGLKAGVVYCCGAIIKDGQLFIYYGGADMVSCVATADLDLFLKELITSGVTKLNKDKNKNKK